MLAAVDKNGFTLAKIPTDLESLFIKFFYMQIK